MSGRQTFLCIILFFVIGCSREPDMRGTYINDASEEITIDCNFRYSSTHLSGREFMPENGEVVKGMNTGIQEETITIYFEKDGMNSPFAKWDQGADEISIGSDVYARKDFVTNERENREFF